MARFEIGDIVRVEMPKGVNKRGVVGISVMYTTWPEARFDGAVGDVAEINPVGPNGIPLYLVNFKGHKNKVAIPWQSQWFREEWIEHVEDFSEILDETAAFQTFSGHGRRFIGDQVAQFGIRILANQGVEGGRA